MSVTDKAWEQWGRQDPYFGVVSHERFRADRIEENRLGFFQTGRDEVAQTLRRYERLFGPLPRDRALDFGCGVGRLTLALAAQFREVVGLDISESMLREAETNARTSGYRNIAFRRANDTLDGAPGEYDFVYSYIVLQHIPVGRGMGIMRQLVSRVRPGGGFLLHFSLRQGGPAWQAVYWARHNIGLLRGLQNLRMGRSWFAPSMQMNPYSMPQILQQLSEAGAKEMMLFTEMHGEVLTVGLIGQRTA